jgi:tRNA(Ile)-lysidine synthase
VFSTQAVLEKLRKSVNARSIWLAYSGGVDSHVLLHLIANAKPAFQSLDVVHVDHGLQQQSSMWSQHCQAICEQLGLNFHLINVDITDINELGIEAAARQARYSAIQALLPNDAVLLTAQHQDDQAETLLLQLLRGAGPKGLAAMAYSSEMGGLKIIRPLLAVSQDAILAYAEHHQLDWIDDPSNQNTDLNRNYIRHQLWPLITQRWPSAAKTLTRSSQLCAESDALLMELGQDDLQQILSHQAIDISQLQRLSAARQRNCLRFYIQQQALPLPSETILQQIIDCVCNAAEDASPYVEWQQCEARRYQGLLYIQPQSNSPFTQTAYSINSTHDLRLNKQQYLCWQASKKGIKADLITQGLTVRFRQGGEKIKLAGKTHHQSLKKLFQQWQVPPWQRERTPLLYNGDELIAVVGYAIAQYALAENDQDGFEPFINQCAQ